MTSRRFVRFSIVGVANTLIHMMVAWGLVRGLSTPLLVANAVAFFVANLISFATNARLTFDSVLVWRRYARFFVVSLTSLIASSVIVSFASLIGVHYLLAIAASAVVSASLGFWLSSNFVFLQDGKSNKLSGSQSGIGCSDASKCP